MRVQRLIACVAALTATVAAAIAAFGLQTWSEMGTFVVDVLAGVQPMPEQCYGERFPFWEVEYWHKNTMTEEKARYLLDTSNATLYLYDREGRPEHTNEKGHADLIEKARMLRNATVCTIEMTDARGNTVRVQELRPTGIGTSLHHRAWIKLPADGRIVEIYAERKSMRQAPPGADPDIWDVRDDFRASFRPLPRLWSFHQQSPRVPLLWNGPPTIYQWLCKRTWQRWKDRWQHCTP